MEAWQANAHGVDWAPHAALARHTDPRAMDMCAAAQHHMGSGLLSHAVRSAAATAPVALGLGSDPGAPAGGARGVDEFGLNEEHFFALSSSEEPASAAGGRAAARSGTAPMRGAAWDDEAGEEWAGGQLLLAGGAGTDNGGWDATDILVPTRARSCIGLFFEASGFRVMHTNHAALAGIAHC